ncbi:MAG: metal ABC transporter permease [Atopococcus tabaci]|uniref:Metal ABC transporter permease n=1 Tax=Atopococcus tabaci TaxID=269774 RepID=A0AA43UCR7_9LACT|nr:metal ABC transporter permease [Atopococcus tabaci]
MDTLLSILTDHTFQIVALGTGILGLLSGVMGVFLTLRKQSLLGDALGHAALPGIVIAFLLIQEKNMLILLLGASLSGLLATALINWMTGRHSVIKQDSALALILSSFFGLGTALLSYSQQMPNAAQAGLETFIFGQASGMLRQDVYLIIVISLLVLVLVAVFWKEFKLITFDADFARTLPGPYSFLNRLLSLLIVVTIVLGLESVGVVLISALLVNPAIAARQWSHQMKTVIVLSGFFGLFSGIIGTLISSAGSQIPTGATIVVVATSITLFSILFAPRRGLIARRRQVKEKEKALQTRLERRE